MSLGANDNGGKIDLGKFPRRLPEKIKTIRNHFRLSPDETARRVGAKNGGDVVAYEKDEQEMLVKVLWGYANLAGCSIQNLIDDDLEVTFGDPA